jgi:hypothetical protein
MGFANGRAFFGDGDLFLPGFTVTVGGFEQEGQVAAHVLGRVVLFSVNREPGLQRLAVEPFRFVEAQVAVVQIGGESFAGANRPLVLRAEDGQVDLRGSTQQGFASGHVPFGGHLAGEQVQRLPGFALRSGECRLRRRPCLARRLKGVRAPLSRVIPPREAHETSDAHWMFRSEFGEGEIARFLCQGGGLLQASVGILGGGHGEQGLDGFFVAFAQLFEEE